MLFCFLSCSTIKSVSTNDLHPLLNENTFLITEISSDLFTDFLPKSQLKLVVKEEVQKMKEDF